MKYKTYILMYETEMIFFSYTHTSWRMKNVALHFPDFMLAFCEPKAVKESQLRSASYDWM